MDSLSASADSNMGRSYASPVVAKNCKGGAMITMLIWHILPAMDLLSLEQQQVILALCTCFKNSPHNQCGGKNVNVKCKKKNKVKIEKGAEQEEEKEKLNTVVEKEKLTDVYKKIRFLLKFRRAYHKVVLMFSMGSNAKLPVMDFLFRKPMFLGL